jgi:ribosome-associated heat shock protein Hsp15
MTRVAKDQRKSDREDDLNSVRLDIWLNVACLFKTRTKARNACDKKQVSVNGLPTKPHYKIHLHDEIEFTRGDRRRIFVVQGLRDKPIAKSEARLLYKDVSPPAPKLDLIDRILKGPPVAREQGQGRPTKKDRRAIDRLSE